MLENPIWDILCTITMILFAAFCGITWILTFGTTARKVFQPGIDRVQQGTYLLGCLASPLVALIDMFTALFRVLVKIFGALAIALFVFLIMIASPALLLIFIAYLSIKYGAYLGEILLERTLEFYKRFER